MTYKSTWYSKRTLVSILLVTLALLAQETATIGTIPNVLGSTTVHITGGPICPGCTTHTITWSRSTSKSNSVTTSPTVTNSINSASTTNTTAITTTATDTTATTTSTTATTPTTSTVTETVATQPTTTGTTTNTIGSTAGSDNAIMDYIAGYAITASSSGALETIGIDLKAVPSGAVIEVAIYSTASNNRFSGLLGHSTSTAAVVGWQDLAVTGVNIVQGTTYYLCFQPSFSSATLSYYVANSGTEIYGAQAYGAWPDPTSTLNSDTGTANMRMTYAASGVIITSATTTSPTSTTSTPTTSTSIITSATTTLTSSTSTITSTSITTSATSTSTVTTTSQTVSTNNQPCSYEVFTQGTTTYAENCLTGLIAYSGAVPETVINDAIAASSGGKVYIESGTYTFTTDPINMGGNVAAIGSTSISNVELYGAGNSTILSAGTNLNGAVIGVDNANGWYIHDLQINGNRASQSDSGASAPYLVGIFIYNSNNDVVEHCYIHDDKTYGIQVNGVSDDVLDNWVVNNNANGIITYGGSNDLVQGNVVEGASDVGISISGTSSSSSSMENTLCTGNTVLNINLDDSPYNVNSGIGIMAGDNGAVSNVTISANQILGGLKFGVMVDPGGGTNVNVVISANTMEGATSSAIYADTTTGLTIENNLFVVLSSATAINIAQDVSALVETNNTTESG